MEKKQPLLEVRDLSVSFSMYDSKWKKQEMKAIANLCLEVYPGEIVAVAGSSGSGKSLLASAVMGLLPDNALWQGTIRLEGETLDAKRIAQLRGRKMALVPQSVSYLDPLMKMGRQVRGRNKDPEIHRRQREVFARYGLTPEDEKLYPRQFSGGMARRALVATAALSQASLIIADEPTPGMDLESAVKALSDFREMADQGKGVLLITHDIDLAVRVADRIAVFYAGTTVEIAAAEDFTRPDRLRHPYSQALYWAMPQNGFHPTAGFQPCMRELPPGCLYAPRCDRCTPECCTAIPPMRSVREGRVRCIHAT
ncbi:MAG: ABC transporter ATP-binding protein [Eubacteriales bacterium]|jgi:peptide/nickel transport system ATP-binding protein